MKYLVLYSVLSVVFVNAIDYFVKLDGNDQNSGTSDNEAWATINRVNEQAFSPGDQIFFEGGVEFAGSLYFDENDFGTPSNPIVVTTYKYIYPAFILPENVTLNNTSGFNFTNFVLVGNYEFKSAAGFFAYTDLESGAKLPYVVLQNIESFGFTNGFLIGADGANYPGFSDVLLINVSAHNNRDCGICTYGTFGGATQTLFSHKNITVRYSHAFYNKGDPNNTAGNTGNGIILSGVDGGLIEYCTAHHNGLLNAHRYGGPVGIWMWHSNSIIIQYSLSYNNSNGGMNSDGGGFDIDGGTTNSVIQYCYSYNNDGPGYLLAQFYGARKFSNNTLRFNIGQNDCRTNAGGGIHLWSSGSAGGVQDNYIYGNTIFMSNPNPGQPMPAAWASTVSDDVFNVQVHNNLFLATDGAYLINLLECDNCTAFNFTGNGYWSYRNNFQMFWEGQQFNSLEEFRESTQQEIMGKQETGIQVDPQLEDAGNQAPILDSSELKQLTAYIPNTNSPTSCSGVNLLKYYNEDPGTHDFLGNSLSFTCWDIGAIVTA